MHDGCARQKFLHYTQHHQAPGGKAAVVQGHYRAIAREMHRRSTWRRGMRFLDVGGGLGIFSENWHTYGLIVTGVDLDQDLITLARTRAREKHLAIRYEVGAADQLPFADNAFDIVFANSLLEYVTDWQGAVQGWIRVLAPGGLLWVETTNVMCPYQREFRWLPLYSWWPSSLKRIAEHLACGPLPGLVNYTQWPAIHWFSFLQLRRFLAHHNVLVSDRFDCMDVEQTGVVKRLLRRIVLSSLPGRMVGYVFLSTIIILATKAPAAQ